MTDKQKLDAIKAEIHRLVDVRGYDREMANDLLAFMNSLPNEPVSEDLEQAVNAYIGYAPEVDESSSTYGKRQAFKAGANWQKQKDSIPVSEDLEQAAFDNAQKNYKEGFRGAAMQAFNEGVLWQKQQMMAKAVDAHCFGFQGDALFSFKLPSDKYLVGSKVKVIVIKEDCI